MHGQGCMLQAAALRMNLWVPVRNEWTEWMSAPHDCDMCPSNVRGEPIDGLSLVLRQDPKSYEGEGKPPKCRSGGPLHPENQERGDPPGPQKGRWFPGFGLEDTVRAARRKVVAPSDHSMPRRVHGRTRDSMHWYWYWNDQLSVLRRKCLTTQRRFTRSKGDPLLREAWEKAISALRQGIKKSRLQC